ncbi:MAG: NADH-quinone oxidoreductase subunit E [Syntrophorhabdus sp. PtaU1.Bin058]|nr:MAG: NADH-quinone oxidoreductase subunit E [Syntrophorhabdus sp. PtaU1.Bin058]
MMNLDSTVTVAVKKFGAEREQLLPVLQYVVSKEKWLSEDTLAEVARVFDMSAAEVYGVASFYSFLDTEARGEYVIRVCRTISCDMSGKEAIMEALQKTLRISVGETSSDRKFTLLETNCIGWCAEGPAMLVNDEAYTNLTPEKVVEVLQGYMNRT